MKRLKKLREQIIKCLQNTPETRDSDELLTAVLWLNFYGEFIIDLNGEKVIALKNLKNVPTADDISRLRAKIQNEEHLYLPLRWETAKQRKWSEDNWRAFLQINR